MLLKNILRRMNVHAEVEFSHGATEAKTPDLVDAIVELTETGSSLRANKLRIVDTVTESATVFIANHKSWEGSMEKSKRLKTWQYYFMALSLRVTRLG